MFTKPSREGIHGELPGFVCGAVRASSDVGGIFALQTTGAAVVFPEFPSFHPFAYSAYFGDMFDHPAAFSRAER